MKKKFFATLFLLFIFFPINSFSEVKNISEGNKNAKIKLIVYESLTCGHCANFHKDVYPALKKDFIDKGLISLEFRNFPLDMVALNASKIAHCKNDGKSEILHFLFKNQMNWVKGKTIDESKLHLKKLLENNNIQLDFEKCISDSMIEDHILEDRVEGVKKFNIEATPTLLINNKKFNKPLNYKNLKKTLEKLI